MSPTGKDEIINFQYESYDVKTKSKRKPSKIHGGLVLAVVVGSVLAVLGLILGLTFGLQNEKNDPILIVSPQRSRCSVGTDFKSFSVATDTSVCSKISCQTLEKGGSAVDAAIAALFCITVVTMHSSGIGGGNFMLIYERKSRKVVFINARETAPGAAHETMFVGKSKDAVLGLLSAGVPGEVKGLHRAHRMYGKLEWRDLVQPSIQLASEGFSVTRALQKAIQASLSKITDPEFRKLLTNKNGRMKKTGDKIVNKKLAETLKEIQEDPESFYSGALAEKIAADFQSNGGLITEDDLRNYDVEVTEKVLKLDLGDVVMYTCPLPSGGPVITQILNILQNYKFSSKSIANIDNTVLTYHRIIEAFKFAFARRPQYGDPKFLNHSKLEQSIKETIDVEFNKKLYEKIWDNSTREREFYGGLEFVKDEGSTSHVSVLDGNGDAVSVTSSINHYFGGKFRSRVTGLLYNNEMDDFSTPGLSNHFSYRPSPNNFIRPGKRPLSSMSPTIFVDKKSGDVRLAIGAAGGSRIISATAWVSMLNLWMQVPLEDAIKMPRLHHQLLPDEIFFNKHKPYQISKEIREGLETKGHRFGKNSTLSVVQAAGFNAEGRALAVSDPRKGGTSWGL